MSLPVRNDDQEWTRTWEVWLKKSKQPDGASTDDQSQRIAQAMFDEIRPFSNRQAALNDAQRRFKNRPPE